MNARRLEIGKKYEALTILPLRDYILFANSQRYDTEYGPSYEFLRIKGKTNMQVIEGSSRPNPDINAFLALFGQWLESQPLTTLQSQTETPGCGSKRRCGVTRSVACAAGPKPASALPSRVPLHRHLSPRQSVPVYKSAVGK